MHKCRAFARFSIFLFSFFLVPFILNAQESSVPQMPPMPALPTLSESVGTLEMPHSPTVSAPTISSSWYVPGKTNIKIITNENDKKTDSETESNQVESIAKTSTFTRQKNISSADIFSLKELGLLSNVDKLISDKNVNLSAILSELNSLEEKVPLTSNENYKSIITPVTKNNISILYFSVNGSEISNLCKNVMFSGIEPNGNFLVATDCKYTQENKPYLDTFYLLFTPNISRAGQIIYDVTPALSQNVVNEKSVLFQLSKEKKLQASKTGSIVSIHDLKNETSIDMLISIGK